MTSPPPRKGRSPARPSRQVSAPRDEAPPAVTALPITLVVGTDTGVGKTWISASLARALRLAGQQVIAVKPIETGITDPPSAGEDGALLAEATGQAGPRRALVRLPGALGPAIAAEQAGVEVDYDDLVARLRSLATPETLLIVEGTGGLLSPLTWQDNHLDLAHSLDARVLLVAADRFGTISHTLMALRVLRAEKIPVLGIVLNQVEAPDESSRTNAMAIQRLAEQTPVVVVPRLDDPVQAAEALKEAAGWILP
jgi:dethiobiotin synthetase